MIQKTINVLRKIKQEIEKVPEVALFSHVSPDGDCIGSMLALGIALETLGKKVTYYNMDPIPRNLKFLPGIDRIEMNLPQYLPDTLIFIDCAEPERAAKDIKNSFQGKQIFNIDHHVSNDLFGTFNWVDPKAAATGEMIYLLLKTMKISISKEMAINLYTAIITDTGRFSYSNTTAKSFKIAAELVKSGIDLVAINDVLFERKSFAQTMLLNKALSNLELFRDGKIATIVLSKIDFEQSGAEENLTEGLVNYARNIEKVEAAALLKEVDTCDIKVSFRSNLWLDVNQVAARFGGGGHMRASGCTIQLPLLEAKEAVITALGEALDDGWNH